MKPKAIAKIVVDVLMTLALLLLMGYPFWGDIAHEWAGAVMFALFLVHHILNRNWYKTIGRGKYTAFRVLQLTVDGLVFLAMAGLMVSGIMLSNRVLAFLHLRLGISFARLLHMISAYWGFVLMALHLGLHWGMFLGIARKVLRLKKPAHLRKTLQPILGGCIAIYGVVSFVQRGLPDYMLVQTQFVCFDFDEPVLQFYLDYLAMMGTFIFLSYYFSLLVRKRAGKKKPAAGTTQS